MKSFKKNIYSTALETNVLCPDCVAHDVVIGTQTWTGCNANLSTYRDGTPIPEVTDAATWASLTTGAWCYYANDSANGPTYGKLYNWYAVNDTLHGGLAPTGYHVPTSAEYTTLITNLGGTLVAGGELKEEGLCHWLTPNTSATDSSGFTALGAGARVPSGSFTLLNEIALFWSFTNFDSINAYCIQLIYNGANVYGPAPSNKVQGLSVRFIKD